MDDVDSKFDILVKWRGMGSSGGSSAQNSYKNIAKPKITDKVRIHIRPYMSPKKKSLKVQDFLYEQDNMQELYFLLLSCEQLEP